MPNPFVWLRGKGRVDWDTPVHEPATAAEFRLIQCQDRILRADETIRRALSDRRYGPDVLLEVMVALGTAPAADDAVLLAVTRSELATVRQALAASQADLTRMERERDQFRSNYLRDAARVDQLDADLVDMELDRDDARALAAQLRDDRDLARAELATATAGLEQLRERLAAALDDRDFVQREAERARSWRVACNNDTTCGACGRRIRRGEAVEPMPGASGWFQHVIEPDPGDEGGGRGGELNAAEPAEWVASPLSGTIPEGADGHG